jgi:hypothetical protein
MTMTTANKRLSEANRADLFALAKRRVSETQPSDEFDAAYDRLATAINGIMVAKFPVKDMKVLERYDVAAPDACIYISTGGYNYDRFEFREGDKRIPVRPGRDCNRRSPLLLEGDDQDAYDSFKAAEKARNAEIAARVNDYKALIWGAKSFNEVASVWADAEALRSAIVGTGTALTVLSSDVIDRIKADAANSEFAEAA